LQVHGELAEPSALSGYGINFLNFRIGEGEITKIAAPKGGVKRKTVSFPFAGITQNRFYGSATLVALSACQSRLPVFNPLILQREFRGLSWRTS
jgi:hypothetical protein